MYNPVSLNSTSSRNQSSTKKSSRHSTVLDCIKMGREAEFGALNESSEFLRLKSAEADREVNLEESRSRTTVLEKIQQIKGTLALDNVNNDKAYIKNYVTAAQEKFEVSLSRARVIFNVTMELERQIFEGQIEKLRRDLVMEGEVNKVKFLAEVDAIKEEYETEVSRALENFVSFVTRNVKYSLRDMDLLKKNQQGEVNSSESSVSQQNQQSQLKTPEMENVKQRLDNLEWKFSELVSNTRLMNGHGISALYKQERLAPNGKVASGVDEFGLVFAKEVEQMGEKYKLKDFLQGLLDPNSYLAAALSLGFGLLGIFVGRLSK